MVLSRTLGIATLFVGFALATAPGCGSSSSGNAGGTGGSTGGAGGATGGAGGSGGTVTPAFKSVNPCSMESAYLKDMTTITAGPALSFSPKCLQVKKGTKVTFTVAGGGMFGPAAVHALSPSMTRTDPGNPIPDMKTGSTIDVTFDKSGFFGYYCPTHDVGDTDSSGGALMNGVVWVTN